MTTLKEVEAEALKLSPTERILLAKRLLSAEEPERLIDPNDPIYQLGGDPVSGSDLENAQIDDDSIWGLGSSPVDCGVSDGSVNHDRYFYGSPGS